ncbi:MAG: XisI protein [Candidatus Poribacteria bacterium]
MGEQNRLREFIKQILMEYARYKHSYGDIEVQTIFDTENDHYQLVNVGWNGYRRIYGCVLHVDIKNGKIWIQHDGTEEGVARVSTNQRLWPPIT